MSTVQQISKIDTGALKKFAQNARRQLREQVTARLDRVLKADSVETREKESAIKELKRQIETASRETVIDRVAYTWFNRFCALRFMDVNHYTNIGVVSPATGFTQPELLAEAKQGHIDDALKGLIDERKVFDLLGGQIPSTDPQQEAFRLLMVAICNYYNSIMPFLFEKIADYTELLMPDDLLSEGSVLTHTRDTLTPDVCKDVEVIGWLYQFYISEKKDEVFEDLKKNKKISTENIPAATQLFTPHWIVRYLVENSLGRLWMLNKPTSHLRNHMDYYVKSEQEETDFVRVAKPEELKICDPACGSGHMLVYAFDLLYAIYEEEGYDPTAIPQLILENNLYGIEIDQRAAELAAFALTMKAREKYRRFFNKPVQPRICVLENLRFESSDLKSFSQMSGIHLTDDLRETLCQFEQCDTYGSLIEPLCSHAGASLKLIQDTQGDGNIFHQQIRDRVINGLTYADYLSPKYHVVIANPPYMGSKGMNTQLKCFLDKNYADVKSDLFSAFIARIMKLTRIGGFCGMMTPFNWMFLSSFEALRRKILDEFSIRSLVRPEYHAFFESAYVPICGFTLFANALPDSIGIFIDLQDFYGAELQPIKLLEAIRNPACGWLFKAHSSDLKKLPGYPIAYWLKPKIFDVFENCDRLGSFANPRAGLATGDNTRFQRHWTEVSFNRIGFGIKSSIETMDVKARWFPCNSGGPFRKWYGNNETVVDWEKDGLRIKQFVDENGKLRSRPQNTAYYFKQGVTWTKLSSSNFAARFSEGGFVFDDTGRSAFTESPNDTLNLLGVLCANTTPFFLSILNPSMSFTSGDISNIPITAEVIQSIDRQVVERAIEISREDWDTTELSWSFPQPGILRSEFKDKLLSTSLSNWKKHLQLLRQELFNTECSNNRRVIDAYHLDGLISPEPRIEDITISNPEPIDEIKSFISYSVGCMFGRYSLDKTGIILANQEQTKQDYMAAVETPSFPIDDDNVIPILDGDWFTDDISERFRKFVRIVFGEQTYIENIGFIESTLGKDIRKYFLRDFYNDHLKRYKKRPIYWLFSSPKNTFNALIYMHRYRTDTVSIVLNDYLREFRNKLAARKSHLESIRVSANASSAEKNKALKEAESLKKIIDELDTYEREVLYPLATQKIALDLDDGVKLNYGKLGKALKAVPGMASEDD